MPTDTKEKNQKKWRFKMTETVIIFICGMFAGVLMEFIISAVVIMKGDK